MQIDIDNYRGSISTFKRRVTRDASLTAPGKRCVDEQDLRFLCFTAKRFEVGLCMLVHVGA